MAKQLYQAPLSNPDNRGERQQEFVGKLAEMDDRNLALECDSYIYMSAFAGNNPRSCYHWMADACYYECSRRGKEHIYSDAYKRIERSCM